MKTAVIVIPTYNESGDIESLILQIEQVVRQINNWSIHILIVDSKSPDRTADIVKKIMKTNTYVHLLETEKEGLGKAYIHGFTYAIETLHAYVVFEMDADFSHDPKEIPNFLKCIEQGADFVIGSRYIKGGSIPKDWGIHRKLFSILGNLIVRFGFMKLKITDWTDGYRAIKTWIINSTLEHIQQYSGYVFQIALLDKAIQENAHVVEIPINFIDRKKGVSKINAVQYVFQMLMYVFTKSSFIKYVIVGVIGFSIDFGLSFILIERVRLIIWLATLLSAEAAIINNFFFNNFWSFSHKKINSSFFSYVTKFLKFNLVSAGAIVIQVIGILILTLIFGTQWWYIYKIGIIAFIVIPYSYFFYNKFIWKDR